MCSNSRSGVVSGTNCKLVVPGLKTVKDRMSGTLPVYKIWQLNYLHIYTDVNDVIAVNSPTLLFRTVLQYNVESLNSKCSVSPRR